MTRVRISGHVFHIVAFLSLVALAVPAGAQDSFPTFSGSLTIELEDDWAYDSDDQTSEFNSLYTKIVPAFTIGFTEEFSVNAELTFEGVQDPAYPGSDRWFDDEGLYVGVLTLNYDTDLFFLYGGKFGVNFGIAWDAAPGLFGTDVAKGYEMAERIGFGGGVNVGNETWGMHTPSVSFFTLDTSPLAHSAFTRREKAQEMDFGAGNTDGEMPSWALAVDGGEFPFLPGFRYHLGFMKQDNAQTIEKDEYSSAVGLEWEIGITDGFSIVPMFEWVNQEAPAGVANDDTYYLTGGLSTNVGGWNMAVAWTRSETDSADGAETNIEQLSVSTGYAFDMGLGIDIGWNTNNTDSTETNTFGGVVSYVLDF